MNNTFIYELSYIKTNTPFYIGKCKNISNRKSQHVLKYGKEIVITIIDQVCENEWKFWEKYYIEQYKHWGFKLENKNNGGGGPTHWDEKQKEKHRIKFKNSNHSKYYTQDVKYKMSISMKGIKNHKGFLNPNGGSKKGWKRSEEDKNKISEKVKINWESNDNLKNRILPSEYLSKRKYIIQYDLKGNFLKEWKGIGFVAKELNINKRGICNCCLGISKTSGGYIWKYK